MTYRIEKLRALLDYEGSLDDTIIDALLDCASALQGLVEYARDSQGIAGYHLNGAVLEWDDVEELHAGMNALAKLNGESDAD